MKTVPYNGFEVWQIYSAQAWYGVERKAGRTHEATTCCLCTSPVRIVPHTEDYSTPFGLHIGAFKICWICHSMIHNRERHHMRWVEYLSAVEDGDIFRMFDLNDEKFERLFLGDALPLFRDKQSTTPRVLIRDLSMGLFNPNGGGLLGWHPQLNEGLV